ncbi:hypothetical protein DRO44_02770 [Candidatus Bathyarchaeota archaeon]|nr:MAG: hypothetical protein DRO44_02770 [Candidatus Bathyarchaeota archaeon]
MKKKSLTLIILTLILLPTSFLFVSQSVKAEHSDDYFITNVNHEITILYNGYIIINDAINLVGNASQEATIKSIKIGFPFQYGANFLDCQAYDVSQTFNVNVNVPFEGHMSFYAVEVVFPEPLNITKGKEYTFNVGFILSNNLFYMIETGKFVLDFPAYPSLTKPVANCSVKLNLPESATNITIAKDDGNVNTAQYFKENLSAFAYYPANLIFSLSEDKLQLFDVEELKREITISGLGEISGSDSYYIISKMSKEIAAIEVVLPPNASIVGAYDQFGRKFESTPSLVDAETNRYRIALTLPVESYKSTRFTVKYSLPSQNYLNAQGENSEFNCSSLLFRNIDYYVKQSSVSILLPEGARLRAPETVAYADSFSLSRNVFQEALTLNMQGVSPLNNILPLKSNLQIIYTYNPLWLSFRPTLWIWALSLLGCAIVLFWKRPKAAVPVTVPTIAVQLSPETIKSFVNSYEEKKRIISELESLETGARKGKIPRRRYKVRKRTLETRLSALSRKLAGYKEKMRVAGGKYADLMRQLEVAETEINEVEANIRSIKMRHRRGDLSLEAYRKLLSDYEHRKERAETTINGVLLRLREDIR